MAPELFAKKSYDEKVDVFAYGTLLWELVARDVPFNGWDTPDIKAKVLAGEALEVPYGTNQLVSQLIADCRDSDPKKRPDFSYIRGVLESVI
jgi:serine/threonine protein kinase